MKNQSNEAKATPRPWSVNMNGELICPADGESILGLSVRRGERLANASLIVRAVNNYEALLEACRLAAYQVDEDKENRTEADKKLFEILCQAIAKAEGK